MSGGSKSRRPKPATRRAAGAPPPRLRREEGYSLSTTGVVHPRLGLGLWALGRWQPEDEARTKACAARGLELGVEWFDTAEVYGSGRSERLLGDVLARARPELRNPFVSTKVSWEHLRPSQVRAALIGSLHRLGRPHVDLYLVHGPDPHVPVPETMQTLASLQQDGMTRTVGVSNFSVEELEAARRALEPVPLVVNQVQYNLLYPNEGDALREYCRRHSMLIEAYTPLARGLLAGRYLDRAEPPAEVRRWAREPFGEERFETVRERARKIRALADESHVSMAAVALHWLSARGAAPVFGVSRPEQVDQVVDAWNHPPSPDVLEQAEAIGRGEHD